MKEIVLCLYKIERLCFEVEGLWIVLVLCNGFSISGLKNGIRGYIL